MYSLPKGWMTDAGYVRQCAEGIPALDQQAVFACGTGDEGTWRLREHYETTANAGVADRVMRPKDSVASKESQSPGDDTDAIAVASHRHGVPWVVVDGTPLEDVSTLRAAVCEVQRARGGACPAGCDDPLPPDATGLNAAPGHGGGDGDAMVLQTPERVTVQKPKQEEEEVMNEETYAKAHGDAKASSERSAVDKQKIKDEVMKMIRDEMASAAKKRNAEELLV
jgi:hypothetical protein